jgi:soluble lytic murein transglycosylase-like protein
MMQRRIVHVLLSLLLLVSQQMAFAHAMSHWTGKLGSSHPAAALAQASGENDLSSSVAQDQSCSQCLAFAQMASAVGSSPRQFAPLDLQTERVGALVTTEAAPRTVCAFHSRAPPLSI